MGDPNRHYGNDPLPFHAVTPRRTLRLTDEGLKVYDYFAAQNVGRAAVSNVAPPPATPDRTIRVTEEELASTIGPLLDIPEVPPLVEEELPPESLPTPDGPDDAA